MSTWTRVRSTHLIHYLGDVHACSHLTHYLADGHACSRFAYYLGDVHMNFHASNIFVFDFFLSLVIDAIKYGILLHCENIRNLEIAHDLRHRHEYHRVDQ